MMGYVVCYALGVITTVTIIRYIIFASAESHTFEVMGEDK